ncbi:MAG: hypothetical protein K0Q79_3370 [Flavipsychrobacter sp.]|jgi:hypothetical protein|nr:hypothetical protein [Flavipsychrobacter sp.]
MGSLKKAILSVSVVIAASTVANAQLLRDYVNAADRVVKGVKTKNGSGSLSQSEIAAGLKEALQVGAKNTTGQLSAVNGFFGNALVKILMPPEAKKVENTLRQLGFNKQVDDAILAMNRAAEDASKKALTIFINAIKGMTIQDGMAILKGGNNAATNYLKNKTTIELTNAFRPVIQESLDKVDATKYWSIVFTTYNQLPTTFNKINPDLPAYVTERALNGVFYYIAEEEAKIRQNPAARVTDLLKKVFG